MYRSSKAQTLLSLMDADLFRKTETCAVCLRLFGALKDSGWIFFTLVRLKREEMNLKSAFEFINVLVINRSSLSCDLALIMFNR